ncbi:MAG: di-trans,poly-cis-decaprenylcistransferase [Anaerolineae bacterium]|nr:di-trans,poly-cis-decaprenylcistransferase [Anaerolineae bacterium]
MRERKEPLPQGRGDSKPPEQGVVPRHVAIIMDGNGRWAQRKGLPRTAGHQAGVQAARRTVHACGKAGIQVLTLYAFSTENWNRPEAEVAFLMRLSQQRLRQEVPELERNGVRLRLCGRRQGLPPSLLELLDQAEAQTRHNERLILNLALNYGGRAEIVDAVRSAIEASHRGDLDPDALDSATFAQYLYSAGLPDLDLVIRTAGEMRLSNFLIWQAADAIFWSTPVLWPDFSEEDLHQAICFWQQFARRGGGMG